MASAQSADYINKQASPHSFLENQLVLLDEHSFLHKNAKLAPKWSGPHRIVRLKNENNVELKLKNGRHLVTHANRLKAYFVPTPKKSSVHFKEHQLATEAVPQQVVEENFEYNDPEPPPPPLPPPPAHRYRLRGLVEAGEQFDAPPPPPPPVSRQGSVAIPSRTPSLAPPTRAPSLAPPSRTHSLAPPLTAALSTPPVKRGRGRPRKTPALPQVAEEAPPVSTPVEQGGVFSENIAENIEQLGVNNVEDKEGSADGELEDEGWVEVKRKKKKRQGGWSAAKLKNFKRFGDIYEPFHSIPSVAPQQQQVAVANPPVDQIPQPPQPPEAVQPPPPPPPVIPVPDLPPDNDDDDDYADYSTDEASEDEVTVRWDYPGASSPLPHTGNSSDELDDFQSAQNTPGPSSPVKARGERTPVVGTSSGSADHAGTSFRPLPLTPKEQKFLDKVLGKQKKKASPVSSRPHQLRSRGRAEPGEVPSFRRTKKK